MWNCGNRYRDSGCEAYSNQSSEYLLEGLLNLELEITSLPYCSSSMEVFSLWCVYVLCTSFPFVVVSPLIPRVSILLFESLSLYYSDLQVVSKSWGWLHARDCHLRLRFGILNRCREVGRTVGPDLPTQRVPFCPKTHHNNVYKITRIKSTTNYRL